MQGDTAINSNLFEQFHAALCVTERKGRKPAPHHEITVLAALRVHCLINEVNHPPACQRK